MKKTMSELIDLLFKRLSATYGSQWLNQWAGVPINDVKAIWINELIVYENKTEAIKYALENLSERCPNAIQFRNLCRQAPEEQFKQLPPPEQDPAFIAEVLSKVAPRNVKKGESKAWARSLKIRHLGGERLNPNQISSYQTALGISYEK